MRHNKNSEHQFPVTKGKCSRFVSVSSNTSRATFRSALWFQLTNISFANQIFFGNAKACSARAIQTLNFLRYRDPVRFQKTHHEYAQFHILDCKQNSACLSGQIHDFLYMIQCKQMERYPPYRFITYNCNLNHFKVYQIR